MNSSCSTNKMLYITMFHLCIRLCQYAVANIQLCNVIYPEQKILGPYNLMLLRRKRVHSRHFKIGGPSYTKK